MRRARRSTSTGCWRSASPPRRPPRAPAVTAVIAAAGSGERLGAGVPKAFVPLAGRPMVEWSIEAFRASDAVSSIVVAAPPGHVHDLGGHDLGVVAGGERRGESVSNAMAAVGSGLVAIHDAARPLLTPELVDALVADLDAAPEAAGVIVAAPVTDTIKRVAKEAGSPGPSSRVPFSSYGMENGALVVEETLDRERLWAAQTPQVFRTDVLRAALEVSAEVRDAATDEAMLVEATGGTVLIHPCEGENLKVTTTLDLRVAEGVLRGRSR